MQKILAQILLLIIAFGLLVPNASAIRRESRTIRVGYYEYDGVNDIDEAGEMSGYGYEYLMEIAKYTGWEYEFVSYVTDEDESKRRLTYAEGLKMLENGEVDLLGNLHKNDAWQQALFFPRFSAGDSYGVLSTRRSNARISVGNPETLNNLSIGLLAGSAYNDQIRAYMDSIHAKNIRYIELSTTRNLEALLLVGHLDAIFTSSLRKTHNERTILRLNPDEVYFATQKDSAYCNTLDNAMEQIAIQKPTFSDTLKLKYFEDTEADTLTLSEDERKYIEENPTVRIGVGDDTMPIEYLNANGAYTGIVADLLNIVSRKTGFEFEYVPMNPNKTVTQNIQEMNLQAISSFPSDYSAAGSQNLRLTETFVRIPMSAIVHDSAVTYNTPGQRVAVVQEEAYAGGWILKHVRDGDFRVYDSRKACVEAVNTGHADVTFLPTYSADYFTSKARYNRVRVVAAHDFDFDIAVAVPASGDTTLYQILNKSINSIDSKKLDEITFQNILFQTADEDFSDLLFKYPITVVFSIALFFIMLILLLTLLYHTRRKAEEERYLSNERLQIALAQTNITVWKYNLQEKCILQAYGGQNLLPENECLENVPESMAQSGYVHPEYADTFSDMFQRVLDGAHSAECTVRLRGNNGAYQWIKTTLTTIYDKAGHAVNAVGVMESAEETIKMQQRAERDALTGLLNRQAFYEQASEFLATCGEQGIQGALFMIDTDNFKQANDRFGHQYGDEVLVEIARKLTAHFRGEDLVARLGGDEFFVMMKHPGSREIVCEKAARLCRELVFTCEGLVTTCSVGATLIEAPVKAYEELYAFADVAMYRAKRSGKNQYCIFDEPEEPLIE